MSNGNELWMEADRRVRDLAARYAALDAELMHWIVVASRERVHERLGFGSFRDYLARVCSWDPDTAGERIRTAFALEELPKTRAAFEAGMQSYSAIRALTRVVIASTEHAWLDAARGRSVLEIRSMVKGREPGDLPTTAPRPDAPHTIGLRLSPDAYASLRDARRTLENQAGMRLDDSTLIALLASRAARGGDGLPAPRAEIALTVCEVCKAATRDAAGEVVPVPAATVERACCDATHVGRLDAPQAGRKRTDIPEAVRRQVLRRDHGRCCVPGCSASIWLDIHHILFQVLGGDHRLSNLILICDAHHRAIHDHRTLIVTGEAPDRLVWTHADGTPYGGDYLAEARRALEGLGFSTRIAEGAVDRASIELATTTPIEEFIRQSLRHTGAVPA